MLGLPTTASVVGDLCLGNAESIQWPVRLGSISHSDIQRWLGKDQVLQYLELSVQQESKCPEAVG